MTADGGSTAPYTPTGTPMTPPGSASMPPSPPPFHVGPGGGDHGGRSLLTAIGVVVAILLAAAALIVALTRGSGQSSSSAPPAAPTSSQPTTSADTTATDKALCEAIAPLIKENSARKNAFTALGPDGSPERDAGLQDFRDQTQDWVRRAQEVLDEHATPPRFFTRTLQRYIDDTRLIVANLRTGPAAESDTAAWNDSLVALAGPFEVCGKLGTPLW